MVWVQVGDRWWLGDPEQGILQYMGRGWTLEQFADMFPNIPGAVITLTMFRARGEVAEPEGPDGLEEFKKHVDRNLEDCD
jgi:hypothetical protein